VGLSYNKKGWWWYTLLVKRCYVKGEETVRTRELKERKINKTNE
jgi:hypothetical protein